MDSSHTLSIYLDSDVTSPRDNENLGTLACWHRRYSLGDVQPKEDPIQYQEALPEDTLIVPVYMLDHSGLTLSTSDFGDPWDSGQLGIYHVSPEEIIEAYGEDTLETRKQAEEGIKAEIEEYSDYLGGNCWGFEVLDADDNHVDGCGGFIGGDPIENGMIEHMDDSILDQLEAAADKAGMSVSPAKLEEYKKQRGAARTRKSMAP